MINNTPKQIISKKRVVDHGEVFTAEREVQAMLDLVKYMPHNINDRFLEPSCGNGNFLIEILRRKLSTVKLKYKKPIDKEFYALYALSTIYGVDILLDNICNAKKRLYNELLLFFNKSHTSQIPDNYWNSVNQILETNLIEGDMLDGLNKIIFREYSVPRMYYFKQKDYKLSDMIGNKGLFNDIKVKPILDIKLKHYLEIC